ncbi:MAG: TetR family transcriptional regulator [Nitrospiraceae bacterium]|nr:TetR family transcriptional regulator [Nitrospiraceae bacterium]
MDGKQRELQQRDEMHLEIARDIFLREGYHSLSISRLAKATGFSRPTLYERFSSKEELIVELGLRCQRELLSFLQKASAFSGRPRERMVAVAAVIRHYLDRYLDDQRISNFSGTDVVLEKVSRDLQRQHAELDKQMFCLLQDIIEDAVRQGDLTFPTGTTAQTLTLTLWILTDGLAAALCGSVPFDHLEIADPVAALLRNVHVLYDGYGWRPLSSEWDYEDTERRIAATVIAEMELDIPHMGQAPRETQ